MGNQFWFKPKTSGYGATPTTWEGWTVMAIYGAIILACVVVMFPEFGALLFEPLCAPADWS